MENRPDAEYSFSVLDYLRYFYFSARHPRLHDYVDKGLGIRARYQRCREFWNPHLQRCKDFQRVCLAKHHIPSIAVLGSGRLFDVDLLLLQDSCSTLTLVDADASAIATAKRELRPNDRALLQDVTGVMHSWTSDLRRLLRDEPSAEVLAAHFADLSAFNNVLGADMLYDTVISLNLLSQIPLFWRDRAATLLQKFSQYSIPDGSLVPGLAEALEASCHSLECAHMAALQRTAATRIVLITDAMFHYYNDEGQESEVALEIDPAGTICRDQWTLEHEDAWMWHIVPKGVEGAEYGVLHEVRAWCWRRRST